MRKDRVFTQEDPIGLAGGLNLYAFAHGDPVNFSDPFGLCAVAVDCPITLVGGAALLKVIAASAAVAGASAYAASRWDDIKAAGGKIGGWVTKGAMGLAGLLGIGAPDVVQPSDHTLTGAGADNAPAVVWTLNPPQGEGVDTTSAPPKKEPTKRESEPEQEGRN